MPSMNGPEKNRLEKAGIENTPRPLSDFVYYPGSRLVGHLPDGREIWETQFNGRGIVRLYEVPLDQSNVDRLRKRLAFKGT